MRVVRGAHRAALARGHVLVVVEARTRRRGRSCRASCPRRRRRSPWQVSSSTRRSCLAATAMIRSMAQAAPHMCTGITALVRGPIGVLDRVRVDRDALVDVDDHRDRPGGEHRHRGRHVGVRRHQDLVARADAERRHRGGQRIGAAAGQRHVRGAEILGVALLEAVAFASRCRSGTRRRCGSPRRSRRSLPVRRCTWPFFCDEQPGILERRGAGFRATAFPEGPARRQNGTAGGGRQLAHDPRRWHLRHLTRCEVAHSARATLRRGCGRSGGKCSADQTSRHKPAEADRRTARLNRRT